MTPPWLASGHSGRRFGAGFRFIRSASLLTCLVLGLSVALLQPALAREDSFEPNDTTADATPLPASTPLESWISTAKDLDVYRIDLTQSEQVTIVVSSVPADYDMELYWVNPSNSQLEFITSSEEPELSDETIQLTLDPAVYYAVVYGWEGANDPNDSYFIEATYTGGGGNEPPSVSVVSPNGGEQWTAGTSQQVQLSLTDADDSQLALTLEYSTNNGSNWSSITSGNFATGNFSFAWTVPNQPSSTCLVRATVSDEAASDSDTSDGTFTIVSIPSGANVLAVGTTSGNSGTQVTVPLTLDNDDVVKGIQTDVIFDDAVATFVSAAAAGRGLGMTVDAQTGPTGVRVVLAFENASTIAVGTGAVANLTFQLVGGSGTNTDLTLSSAVLSGASAENLNVTTANGQLSVTGGGSNTAPVVTLSAPNGGETLAAGSLATIQYSATDIDGQTLSIDLEYSTNGGGSWVSIATGISNTGSFAWTVPNTATTGGRVRVTADDGQATTRDQSDGNFTITTSSSGNEVALGSASGANGTEVTIPLELSNDTAVKALQVDVVMNNPSVASFVSAAPAGRGLGMVGDAQAGATGVRLVLRFENATTLPAGSGTVANLTYRLTGSQNSSSILSPTGIVLSDPDANEIAATGVNGSLTVTTGPADTPALQVAALKNPGRTRTLQVFVIVENGSGSAPTVTAGSANVTMESMGNGMYQGTVFASSSASSMTITASDTNGVGTGTGSVTVSF